MSHYIPQALLLRCASAQLLQSGALQLALLTEKLAAHVGPELLHLDSAKSVVTSENDMVNIRPKLFEDIEDAINRELG